MARTRDIRPGFFRNESLGDCQPLARLLFAGLWVYADREGRLEDRPKRLKSDILPYDECNVNDLLNELAGFGFIVRYEVEGKFFIQISRFSDNQRVHPKELPSVIPAPEYIQNRVLSRPNVENRGQSVASCTIPSSPSLPTKPSSPPTPKGGCQRFDEFWKVYPKRQDKAKAKSIWVREKLDAIAPVIIDAVQRFAQTTQWKAEEGRYIPKPTTFLNGQRWEDEIAPIHQQTAAQTRTQVMLEAWRAGKSFLHKASGKTVPAEAIEPFNHNSQKVTEENPTAFRSITTGNHAFFTEFEVVT